MGDNEVECMARTLVEIAALLGVPDSGSCADIVEAVKELLAESTITGHLGDL